MDAEFLEQVEQQLLDRATFESIVAVPRTTLMWSFWLGGAGVFVLVTTLLSLGRADGPDNGPVAIMAAACVALAVLLFLYDLGTRRSLLLRRYHSYLDDGRVAAWVPVGFSVDAFPGRGRVMRRAVMISEPGQTDAEARAVVTEIAHRWNRMRARERVEVQREIERWVAPVVGRCFRGMEAPNLLTFEPPSNPVVVLSDRRGNPLVLALKKSAFQ